MTVILKGTVIRKRVSIYTRNAIFNVQRILNSFYYFKAKNDRRILDNDIQLTDEADMWQCVIYKQHYNISNITVIINTIMY